MNRNTLTERITPPKFKVGRFVLNEYEAREVVARIAEGTLDPNGIVMEDMDGNEVRFDKSGTTTNHKTLNGWGLASSKTKRKIRANRSEALKKLYNS